MNADVRAYAALMTMSLGIVAATVLVGRAWVW